MGITITYHRMDRKEAERLRGDKDFVNAIIEDRRRKRLELGKAAFHIAVGLSPSIVGYPRESPNIEVDAVASLLTGADGEPVPLENGAGMVILNNVVIFTALQELENLDKETMKESYALDVARKMFPVNDYDEFFEQIIWRNLMVLKQFLEETSQAHDMLLMVSS